MRFVSFSQVDLFLKCERQYWFEYVLGNKREDTPILVIGKEYHSAVEDYLRRGALGYTLSVEASAFLTSKTTIDQLSLQNEMRANLTRLREYLLNHLGRPTVIERKFEDETLGYKGTIDAVFPTTPVMCPKGEMLMAMREEPCVIDWKSVTSDRRRSARDAVFSPQLALYAIVAGVKNAGFVEIPRNLDEPIKARFVHYTEEELSYWRSWLVGIREAMLSRGTDPAAYHQTLRSNPLCSITWCSHFLTCYPSKE